MREQLKQTRSGSGPLVNQPAITVVDEDKGSGLEGSHSHRSPGCVTVSTGIVQGDRGTHAAVGQDPDITDAGQGDPT